MDMPASRLGLSLGLAACAVAACAMAAAARDPTAPRTPARPVVDHYHGVAVTDPYRWLEDGESPAVQAWSAAQNQRTRGYLDGLAIRPALHARLMAAASKTSPSYHNLSVAGGRLFTLTVQPPRQQPMVAVMPLDADPSRARTIVDPNTLDPSGQTAIDWFVPSPDGGKVAVSLSRNGSEDGTVHVFDVATGKQTGEAVPRAQYPTAGGSLAWRADSAGFWYTRYPGASRPPADRHFYQQVYYHALGTDPAKDRYVLGRDFPRIAEIALDARQNPSAVLVSVANGDGGQFEQYVIKPDGGVVQVTHFADEVVAGSIGPDNVLYLVSKKNAPRGPTPGVAARRPRPVPRQGAGQAGQRRDPGRRRIRRRGGRRDQDGALPARTGRRAVPRRDLRA